MARCLRLRLHLDVDPVLVSVTRRFVEEALSRFLHDLGLISRVAMATHELLENAAKYAGDRSADLSVTVDGIDGDGEVTLRLSNEADPVHLERLYKAFSELHGCRDPMMFYLDLMRQNARRPSISGLGLARILAEGEMTLDLSVEGRMATIVARTPIGLPS